MPNTVLSNSVIAKEALMLLENELVLGNLVHRGYEDEFAQKNNGYTPGSTINIRKPARYTVRTNATMNTQDSTEGKTTLAVDQQHGVDVGGWTSADRTLTIPEFSKRFLKPAISAIAQSVDAYVASLYKDVWNWAGAPASTPKNIGNYADFAKAPLRLDEMSVPTDDRHAILSPADHWGLVGATSALYVQSAANTALEKAKLPMLGGVSSYMTQNTPSHMVGTKAGTPQVLLTQSVAYSDVKDTGKMTLNTDGWSNSQTVLKQGDVFTIQNVYAVNPVSKAVMPYLQQFVVRDADVVSHASGGTTPVIISPPIITSGAYQTVNAAAVDNANITVVGNAGTIHSQNMVFHRNAFALAMVPMVAPEGAVDVQRATHNGLSVRMIPIYDGSNDKSAWRLDVLFGAKAIYPDLATRVTGTAAP